MLNGPFIYGLTLKETYFDHPSQLHGIGHTYRVMSHVITLGNMIGHEREMRLALCAAFIHDMARKNDGYCTEHGMWAAESKLPLFSDFFVRSGVDENDLPLIGDAVTNHSVNVEFSPAHPAFMTTALLKDADALDRCRLGEHNLNPSFLRIEASHQQLGFAKKLYHDFQNRKFATFTEVLNWLNLK